MDRDHPSVCWEHAETPVPATCILPDGHEGCCFFVADDDIAITVRETEAEV